MLTEFLHMMSDPAHWMFELASGAIVALVLAPLGRWAWHRGLVKHDAEAHPERIPDCVLAEWVKR